MGAHESLGHFISMGQHGVFVWSAWAIVVLALLLLVWHSRYTRRRVIAVVQLQQQRKHTHQTDDNKNETHS